MLKPSKLLRRLFPTVYDDNRVYIDNVNETTTSNIIVSEDDTPEKLLQEAVEECIKDIINIISEETEEEIPKCGICLDSQTQPFITSCNHSFCVSCLVRASEFKCAHDFPCPMCRGPIENMADAVQLIQAIEHIRHLPPFNPENYPIHPDFGFIAEEDTNDRLMFMHAYNVVTREDKWQLLRNYVPSPDGFQWSNDPELSILIGKIDDDYPIHSGFSLGYTMRKMYFISMYGYYEFKNEWCRCNYTSVYLYP